MAVVFPAPLAPRKPKISPCLTLNEIWSTAVKLPNCLVKPSTSMAYRPVTCGSLKREPFRRKDRTELLKNTVRSVNALNLSFTDKCNTVTAFHLVQVRCCRNDGKTFLFQFQQHVPKLLSGYRVHTGGRFVQEQYGRPVNQCATQSQLFVSCRRIVFRLLPVFERFYLLVDTLYQCVVLPDSGIEKRGKKVRFSSTDKSWYKRKNVPAYILPAGVSLCNSSPHPARRLRFSFIG